MKTAIFFGLLTPVVAFSQLRFEWKTEFSDKDATVTSILLDDDKVISSLYHTTYKLSGNGEVISAFGPASGGYVMQRLENELYFIGGPIVTVRTLDGAEMGKFVLTGEDNNLVSARDGIILNDGIFIIKDYNYLLKYSLTGARLFTKKIADLTTNLFIKAGGSYLYLYSIINQPELGGRLIQFDALGTEKWSVAPGISVVNIVADNKGNCYVLGGSSGKCYVQKYDQEGKQIWSSHTQGISYLGGCVQGDSLFLCGGVTTEKPYNEITDNDRLSAWAIYSVETGERILSQTFDLYPGEGFSERFHRIALDSQTGNIFLGGTYSEQNPRCFLVKLSREGKANGIRSESSLVSFNIFPNPGSRKFTISCDNPGGGTLKIVVRNSLGQMVQTYEIPCEGRKSWDFDLGRQPAGSYSVEIVSGGEKVVKQVIVD